MPHEFGPERESLRQQLIKSGISDKIATAVTLEVDRHKFIPLVYHPEKDTYLYHPKSYQNRPLGIGEGQTISQPYIVGLMINLLHLDLLAESSGVKILEIGTGLSYNASIISSLLPQAKIYSLENNVTLCQKAQQLSTSLSYHNIHIYCQDGYHGLASEAPFDRIIVTADITKDQLEKHLLGQLKEDGILVAPVKKTSNHYRKSSHLYLYRKKKGRIIEEKSIGVRFVPFTRGIK